MALMSNASADSRAVAKQRQRLSAVHRVEDEYSSLVFSDFLFLNHLSQ